MNYHLIQVPRLWTIVDWNMYEYSALQSIKKNFVHFVGWVFWTVYWQCTERTMNRRRGLIPHSSVPLTVRQIGYVRVEWYTLAHLLSGRCIRLFHSCFCFAWQFPIFTEVFGQCTIPRLHVVAVIFHMSVTNTRYWSVHFRITNFDAIFASLSVFSMTEVKYLEVKSAQFIHQQLHTFLNLWLQFTLKLGGCYMFRSTTIIRELTVEPG